VVCQLKCIVLFKHLLCFYYNYVGECVESLRFLRVISSADCFYRIHFAKSIDQTPPLDVHISCKTFAASTLIIFSHAFKTDSFLMFPLVESINSRIIARFVRVSSLVVVLFVFITR